MNPTELNVHKTHISKLQLKRKHYLAWLWRDKFSPVTFQSPLIHN